MGRFMDAGWARVPGGTKRTQQRAEEIPMSSTVTGQTAQQREAKTGGVPTHRYLAGAERRDPAAPAAKPGVEADPGLMKDVAILFVSALVLGAVGIGAYWSAWTPGISSAQPAHPAAGAAPAPAPRPAVAKPPAPTTVPVAVHTDVFFDLNRTRLRADAVATLQEHAARIREEGGGWRVLVQGYADGQGGPAYNLSLAQRRAEAVRQFLVELGVPETAIRVMTIGQAGTLCEETTAECQQLNRRVHIEMRRVTPAASGPAGRATVVGPRTVQAGEILSR
jgi:peptidoglycan-associated lipoprotein